jgi:hypothetical protein
MLFEPRLQAGLRDGAVSVAFRRWRRPQVVAGRSYRSPIGMVEVDSIVPAELECISEADAQAAGYPSASVLVRDLKGPADGRLYRLQLRMSPSGDPRALLADSAQLEPTELEELSARLARLDANLGRPWTRATLETIQARPTVRAADLMQPLGWSDLHQFKLHVRKLKALGLTLSLGTGYKLSPRGAAYLEHERAQTAATIGR